MWEKCFEPFTSNNNKTRCLADFAVRGVLFYFRKGSLRQVLHQDNVKGPLDRKTRGFLLYLYNSVVLLQKSVDRPADSCRIRFID